MVGVASPRGLRWISAQSSGGTIKAEAVALRAHGYTMQQIADVFAVTRPRISALLKDDA